MFYTPYEKKYTGHGAAVNTAANFRFVWDELSELYLPTAEQPIFKRDYRQGKTRASMEFQNGTNTFYLTGTVWMGGNKGTLNLGARHNKGLKANFPILEELARKLHMRKLRPHALASAQVRR